MGGGGDSGVDVGVFDEGVNVGELIVEGSCVVELGRSVRIGGGVVIGVDDEELSVRVVVVNCGGG